MSSPYTDLATVTTYLGKTLTTAQNSRVTTLIAAVAAYFDRYTGGWGMMSDTLQAPLICRDVQVPLIPISSVTEVQTRWDRIGEPWVTLNGDPDAGALDYELFDASLGWIRFLRWGKHILAKIEYAPNRGTVPDDLKNAATEVVGVSALATILTDRAGISQLRLDADTVIQYSGGQKLFMTEMAMRVLDDYSQKAIIG